MTNPLLFELKPHEVHTIDPRTKALGRQIAIGLSTKLRFRDLAAVAIATSGPGPNEDEDLNAWAGNVWAKADALVAARSPEKADEQADG